MAEASFVVVGWITGVVVLVILIIGPLWMTVQYLLYVRRRRQWWLDHPEVVAARRLKLLR